MRDGLIQANAQIGLRAIAIEACTGTFYWQRQVKEHRHTAKIISPQYGRPFVRRQKNDGTDAEAIYTAARQPPMRFVPKQTIGQFSGQTGESYKMQRSDGALLSHVAKGRAHAGPLWLIRLTRRRA